IAEAEPPADSEGRPQAPKHAAGGFAGRAVEQPDQQRKRDEAGGEEIIGRLAKHRQRSGKKGHERAPPTPKQNYPAGQALHAYFRVARIRTQDLSGRGPRSKRRPFAGPSAE